MVPVPIRCLIPYHLKRIGQNQQWLANKANISKQQLSDYVNMRYMLGITKSKHVARLLRCKIDDLYEWEWREE